MRGNVELKVGLIRQINLFDTERGKRDEIKDYVELYFSFSVWYTEYLQPKDLMIQLCSLDFLCEIRFLVPPPFLSIN